MKHALLDQLRENQLGKVAMRVNGIYSVGCDQDRDDHHGVAC
jgi:hypothetical protein